MFKKTTFFIVIALAAVLVFPNLLVLPIQAAPQFDLPDRAGVYDVPGQPHLKLRVFVYHGKSDNPGKGGGNGKPTPPPPSLVCGLADPNSTAVIPGAGWTLPSNWTYNLNPSSVPSSVGSNNLASIADNGFAAWLGVNDVNQAVNVTQGSDTSKNKAQRDGLNIIAWGRTGSSLATTYIWYNTVTHQAVEIDTIMNKSYSWAWADPAANPNCAYEGVYDAQNILTHELGHTFGLDDTYTSPYINNTMYGYGSTGEVKKNTLTTGDAAGVAVLY